MIINQIWFLFLVISSFTYIDTASGDALLKNVAIKTEKSNNLISQGFQPKHEEENTNKTQKKHRYKRQWFTGPGFPGFLPSVPIGIRPASFERDPGLEEIYHRVQEIATIVRQPLPPLAPPPRTPLIIPALWLRPVGCDCNSDRFPVKKPPGPKPRPKPRPRPRPPPDNVPTPKPEENNSTMPNVTSRDPDVNESIDDDRRNWGLFVNETEVPINGEDFSRPISFDPIPPNKPLSKPPPPVDHGSTQAGQSEVNSIDQDVPPKMPPPSQFSPNKPGGSAKKQFSSSRPINVPSIPPIESPGNLNYPLYGPPPPVPYPSQEPTACDGAILSCCHKRDVTYECFVNSGCSNPDSFGNPCEPSLLLQVIEKYQRFYVSNAGR